MTKMDALLTNVLTGNAFTPLLALTPTLAPMIFVLTELANTLQRTVMTKMLVQLTLVMQTLDARTPQLLAMTTMQTLLILATFTLDVFSLLSTVTMEISAQPMLLLMESANILQSLVMMETNAQRDLVMQQPESASTHQLLSPTQMLAQSELVMQLRELLTLLVTVRMETSALSTIVMLSRDANMFQSLFLQTAQENQPDSLEMQELLDFSEKDVSKSHKELANLSTNTNAIQQLDSFKK
jgi:hypothetical protein